MEGEIDVNTVDREEVRKAISTALGGRNLDDLDLEFLLLRIRYLSDETDGSIVKFPVKAEAGETFDVRPFKSRYIIKVSNAVVLSAVVALDALATFGVASTVLTVAGVNLGPVAALKERNGELCNFISLERKKPEFPFASEQLTALTYSQPCLHPGFRCAFGDSGTCSISSKDVSYNLQTMYKKEIVSLDRDGKVCRIA